MEGTIYTVEEVSDLLGIPRPTLYRYLREYSIPHLRRSGKISIPEESFDLIREARDLHKEGLGTESVRRVLREGRGAGSGELSERLDALSETLKDLQEKSATDEPISSPALRTMLARQSLLISAVFNLTEMVEDLLLANGKPRKTVFGDVSGEVRAVTPLPEYAPRSRQLEGAGGPALTVAEPAREAIARPSEPVVAPRRRGSRFGYLSRRRRRLTLGILSALALFLVAALLTWHLPSFFGEDSPDISANRDSANAAGAVSGTGDGEGRESAGGVGTTSNGGESGDAPADKGASKEAPTGDPGSVAAGSEGVRPGEVPDVRGQGVEEAARTLSDAGYTLAAIRTESGPEEAGTATGTDPEMGTAAEPGTPVTLVVSGGPDG